MNWQLFSRQEPYLNAPDTLEFEGNEFRDIAFELVYLVDQAPAYYRSIYDVVRVVNDGCELPGVLLESMITQLRQIDIAFDKYCSHVYHFQ